MKIECSGPNGETFEVNFEYRMYWNESEYCKRMCDEQNAERLASSQKALETWCNAFKADKTRGGE